MPSQVDVPADDFTTSPAWLSLCVLLVFASYLALLRLVSKLSERYFKSYHAALTPTQKFRWTNDIVRLFFDLCTTTICVLCIYNYPFILRNPTSNRCSLCNIEITIALGRTLADTLICWRAGVFWSTPSTWLHHIAVIPSTTSMVLLCGRWAPSFTLCLLSDFSTGLMRLQSLHKLRTSILSKSTSFEHTTTKFFAAILPSLNFVVFIFFRWSFHLIYWLAFIALSHATVVTWDPWRTLHAVAGFGILCMDTQVLKVCWRREWRNIASRWVEMLLTACESVRKVVVIYIATPSLRSKGRVTPLVPIAHGYLWATSFIFLAICGVEIVQAIAFTSKGYPMLFNSFPPTFHKK